MFPILWPIKGVKKHLSSDSTPHMKRTIPRSKGPSGDSSLTQPTYTQTYSLEPQTQLLTRGWGTQAFQTWLNIWKSLKKTILWIFQDLKNKNPKWKNLKKIWSDWLWEVAKPYPSTWKRTLYNYTTLLLATTYLRMAWREDPFLSPIGWAGWAVSQSQAC